MRRYAVPAIWTYCLIGINLWFGLLMARYGWNTKVLFLWGGMSGHMPQIQSLMQLPPFSVMTPDTLVKMPRFIDKPLHGTLLVLIRAIWASFLHFSWQHLLSNMSVLFLMGRAFERANYNGMIVPVYLITGMVSMVSAYYFQPDSLTAGASGALFGIMGVSYVLYLRAKVAFRHDKINTYALNQYKRLGYFVCSLFVVNIVSTFTTPDISIVGHIAGLIAGLILGLIIPLRRD